MKPILLGLGAASILLLAVLLWWSMDATPPPEGSPDLPEASPSEAREVHRAEGELSAAPSPVANGADRAPAEKPPRSSGDPPSLLDLSAPRPSADEARGLAEKYARVDAAGRKRARESIQEILR